MAIVFIYSLHITIVGYLFRLETIHSVSIRISEKKKKNNSLQKRK